MRKGFKKMMITVFALAIMLAMGVTVYAAGTSINNNVNGKQANCNMLTDEQKTQFANEAKTRLQQNLADGKITQEQYDAGLSAIEEGKMPFARGGKHGFGMTEEQRAAKDGMRDKWDALTDAQKSEIYDLHDQKAAIDNQIIDKFIEFGVMDSDTAASMKERIETKKGDMRKNGGMPMAGGKGMRSNGSPASSNSSI